MSIRVLTDEETHRARAGATDLDLFEADRSKPDLAAALDTEAADVGRFDGTGWRIPAAYMLLQIYN